MSDRQGPGYRGGLRGRGGLFGRRHIPIRYLAPNFFTLLALCAGVSSIRVAIEGRTDLAIALVLMAAVLDAVDGRVARAFNAQSRFGAELDSLADFVSFGVAPAILIFLWGLSPLKGLGWIAVLVFACAASLRLARFNAALDEDRPRWQAAYFTGVPAPAGAIAVMLPLYLEGTGLLSVRDWPVAVAIYVVIVAALLVSTIPTYSGKLAGERIAREYVAPALIGAALAIALLATYPFATLSLATIVYLAFIPIGMRRFAQRRRDWEAQVARGGAGAAPSATSSGEAVAPSKRDHGAPDEPRSPGT